MIHRVLYWMSVVLGVACAAGLVWALSASEWIAAATFALTGGACVFNVLASVERRKTAEIRERVQ